MMKQAFWNGRFPLAWKNIQKEVVMSNVLMLENLLFVPVIEPHVLIKMPICVILQDGNVETMKGYLRRLGEMKARLLIIFTISITIVALFTVNSFMNLYHYGEYLKMDDGHVWHCSSDGHKQFCDNTSIRMMELFGLLPDSEEPPYQLEKIEGYAIDYGREVKHLPFADVCTDPMKIILLSYSNISSTDEEFTIEDVKLPFGMNLEDFERCAFETSFTKERSNMVP